MRKLLTVILILIFPLSSNAQQRLFEDIQDVRSFIKKHMPHTMRECKKDTLGSIALPKPYSVPSLTGVFQQDMFYWDTYFTNIGLILDADFEQALNNIDNILFLIDKYGFMPNGSNVSFLNRSQPPFASMMVRDIYEKSGDKVWLSSACRILEKEYNFWMTKRLTPTGLNRYSNSATKDELTAFYEYMRTRFPELPVLTNSSELLKQAFHFIAEAESGWDFSPRFDFRCEDYNPIDLNANLYVYEQNFVYFYNELKKKDATKWLNAAKKRKNLLNKYCYNSQDGCFYDYDFVNDKLSPIYSAAVFNLLWAEVLTKPQAKNVVKHLSRLEYPCGIAACERGKRQRAYQWDFPSAWASFNLLSINGLDRYGFRKDACRIARKYVDSIIKIYRSSDNLWEKYNAEFGNLEVKNEYEMPPFMGWTAGAFIYASDYLVKQKEIRDEN